MTKSRRSDSPASPPSRAAAKTGAQRPSPGRPANEQRSAYVEAIALYESAVGAFQRKDLKAAAERFRRLISSFPGEAELVDRARLHLAACDRRLAPLSSDPRTTAERLYAATMAINEGVPGRALQILEAVGDGDPQVDAADYLRAVAETERGAFDQALSRLRRAIDRNPSHRSRARVDPDLSPLRQLDGFAGLLSTKGRDPNDASRPARIRR